MTHKEPSTDDEIPPLCKQTFLSISRGLVIAYVLSGVFLSACCTAIAWGMSTERTITEIKSTQAYLTDQINNKLDRLLKAKGE